MFNKANIGNKESPVITIGLSLLRITK